MQYKTPIILKLKQLSSWRLIKKIAKCVKKYLQLKKNLTIFRFNFRHWEGLSKVSIVLWIKILFLESKPIWPISLISNLYNDWQTLNIESKVVLINRYVFSVHTCVFPEKARYHEERAMKYLSKFRKIICA